MKTEYKATTLPKITPSSIHELNCNKRYWTLRVLNQWPAQKPQSRSAFGLCFHEILAAIYDPRNATRPDLTHLDTISRRAFARLRYADQDLEATDRDRCERMVLGYVERDDPEDASGTIAVERYIEQPVNFLNGVSFLVSGRLDRIIVRADGPGTLVIRDYKTSTPRLDLESAFVTLWLSKLGYPGYENYVLEYDWIDEVGRVERDVVHAKKVKGLYHPIIQRIEKILTDEKHPAEPNEGCVFCPLKPECQPSIGITVEPEVNPFDGEE